MMGTIADLKNNPFLERDGGLHVSVGGALGLAGFLAGVFVFFTGAIFTADSLLDFSYWRIWEPSGRSQFGITTGVALAVVALSSTLLASLSIAEERDRGTWREIILTPLTPNAIVAGKFLALTVVILPLALLTAPLLAVASMMGDVTAIEVALGTAFVVVHLPFFLALGLLASAHAPSVRVAVVLSIGMLLTIGGVPIFGPVIFIVASMVEDGFSTVLLPQLASHSVILVGGTFLFLRAARERLTPTALKGDPSRRLFSTLLLLLAPLTIGVAVSFWQPMANVYDHELGANLMSTMASVGMLALLTVVLNAVALRHARRVIVVDTLVFTIGSIGAAMLVASTAAPRFFEHIPSSVAIVSAILAVLPVAVGVFFAGAVARLFAADGQKQTRGVTVSLVLGAVTMFVLPAIGLVDGDGLEGAFGFLAHLNPLMAAASVVSNVIAPYLDDSFRVLPSVSTVVTAQLTLLVSGVAALFIPAVRRREAHRPA